ncbi:hypothetical protein C8J57DRAFT_1363010 [Mycena rebaudengoi]|nr:hypothetical protein C8J57DRAFT_1363010 [Mycena rebaudengoi]
MDSEAYPETEFTHSSTTDNPESSSYSSSGSGMFSGSQHFTVTGQNFTNITHNYPSGPTVPSAFQMIPLGDIDLQKEIHLHVEIGIADRRARVRRLYSAKVNHGKSNATVAMYQGNGAEEEWRQDIARYMTIRHPNIIQVFGNLIPLEHFVNLHRYSHFSMVYIYAYSNIDFQSVSNYFRSTFQHSLLEPECTFWIRGSSGRLCTDLVESSNFAYLFGRRDEIPAVPDLVSLDSSNMQAIVIDSLTLKQYHRICDWNLSNARIISTSSCIVVTVGAVLYCPLSNRLEDSVRIPSLLDLNISSGVWANIQGMEGELSENGWTRFKYGDASNNTIRIEMWDKHFWTYAWLSQANYIFHGLQITANLEDYVLVEGIYFDIVVSAGMKNPPTGFLFLCPGEDFRIDPSSFCWPDCPVYWALDPLGVKRLSKEESARLGFPSIQLKTTIPGWYWDSGVYSGLRQFHKAKGFDPDSQYVARYLLYPLHKFYNEADPLFAHVNDEDLEDDHNPASRSSDNMRLSASNEDGK